ncbi:MAG: hypothetical protein ACOX7L_01995 [Dethiobacteria bacterium]
MWLHNLSFRRFGQIKAKIAGLPGPIYLALVTAAAVYLRFWFIRAVPTEQLFDFATYQEIAVNVARHAGHTFRGLPIAWQGPAYPLALGHIYRWFGSCDILTGKYFNVALSILTLVAFYLLLRRLGSQLPSNQRPGSNKFFIYGAYTLAAFLPNFLAYNNVIGTEVFVTFLFIPILLLQVYKFNNWLRMPLLGALIGAAALAKPFFLAYPLVAALYFWLRERDLKKTAAMLAVLLVAATAVVAPWTCRNYKKFGRFIPISYNSGYVSYINNNDANLTGSWMDLREVPAGPELQETINVTLRRSGGYVQLAADLEPALKKAARRWITENPLEFVKLGFLRLKQTFFMGAWDIRSWAMNGLPSTQDPREEISFRRNLSFFHSLSDVLIYILSSCGLLYMLVHLFPVARAIFRRELHLPDPILIPTINLAFLVFVIFAFEGQARYNFPALPLLIIASLFFAGR